MNKKGEFTWVQIVGFLILIFLLIFVILWYSGLGTQMKEIVARMFNIY